VTLRRLFQLTAFVAVLPFLAGHAAAQGGGDWQKSYDALLARYATPSGVKYAEWKANSGDLQRLKQVVEAIGSANASGMDRDGQLAFYINAYNAWILHEALEKYPTKSVKDTLFTFFTGKRIKVAGPADEFSAPREGHHHSEVQ
jgi:hypothetical protein